MMKSRSFFHYLGLGWGHDETLHPMLPIRIHRSRLQVELLEDRTLPSGFYNVEVIAQTGQAGLTGIVQGASINDAGKVAFVGQLTDGQGIFVGNGSTLSDINPTFSHDPSRTFGGGVQINNHDQVVAVDRTSLGVTQWRLRTWDANGTTNSFGNTFYIYASASSPPDRQFDFDALASSVSLSNNGNVAYASFDYQTNQWQLRLQNDALPDPLDVPAATLTAPQSLRPMAANARAGNLGYVVVRDGSTSFSPIVLYGNVTGGGIFNVPIAQVGIPYRFTALGQSPGISDDGQIVVFYGQDAAGPGIFASVNTTSHGRQIVRIASASANGPISQFVPDERVGVNGTELTQGAVTITYVAYDANGNKGVYASRLTFIPPANAPTNFSDPTNFVVSDPIPALQAGDTIPGLGTVQDVHLYDPINNTGFGQIAIWVQTTGGTGIVRATSPSLTAVANSVTELIGPPVVPGGIIATFRPAQGTMTMAQAALAVGVDHFNWVQKVTSLPATWTVHIADQLGWTDPGGLDDLPEWGLSGSNQLIHNGNPNISDNTVVTLHPTLGDPAIPFPISDPIQQVPGGHSYVFYDSASDTWIPWDASTEDNLPEYYNDPGAPSNDLTLNNLANNTTAGLLTFYDRPSQPPGTVTGINFLAFRTSLVGVRADSTIVDFPNGLGTSFTWKSNTTGDSQGTSGGVSDIGYSYVPSMTIFPPLHSGGVFDVQADNALPPANVIVSAPIDNQAVTPGTPITFAGTATDPFPGATLTFSLAPGAPAGATIDPSTGVFTWTPTAAQAGRLYSMTVNVADNSTPALSGSQSFVVNVLNKLSVTAVTELTPPTPGPLQVAIDFNEALQPSVAQNIALYKIGKENANSLPIQSAVYTDNGTQHRVILTVAAGTVVIPGFYHVYIDVANLTATNGDHGAPKADQLWVDVTQENTLKPITVQPDGSLAVSGTSQFLGYGAPQYVVAGNFTGSGNADLVVVTNGMYDPVLLLKSNGDGSYAPPVSIALGGTTSSQGIWSVDWNHDGSPDLIIASASGPPDQWNNPHSFYSYVVLLNDGHGNFTNALETPIPVSDPNSYYHLSPFVATAFYDLNGDGQWEILHLGLVTAGGLQGEVGDASLEVIGKDSHVGYTPQMELPMGINNGVYVLPSQLSFADLNGDGKPDIISRNAGYYADQPGISVLMSTPNGYVTGSPQIINPVGGVTGMGNGAFTGPGQKDIAFVHDNYSNSYDVHDGDVIELLKNDGHGNFTAQTPIILTRRDVESVTFADVNKDGVSDMVLILAPGSGQFGVNTYNYVSQLSVWTLVADGKGGFTPTTPGPVALVTTDQSGPTSVALTDLDADGFPDLVLGSNQFGAVRIAINDGTGTMRPPTQALPYLGTRQAYYSTYYLGVSQQAFADFNNDGQTDFVTTAQAGLDVYLGQTDGAFKHIASLPSPDTFIWVKVGDLNNDAIPDIVFGDTGYSHGMAVYLGNGDGTFRQAPNFILQPPSGNGIGNATLVDIDGDGKLDAVAYLNQGVPGFGVYFGDGKGGLAFNANTFVAAQTGYSQNISPTVGDFNRDGKLDLLVPRFDNSTATYSLIDYLGAGNGTFTPGPVIYSGASLADVQLLVGDVNGDGKPDVVGLKTDYHTTVTYLGDGNGGFQTILGPNVSMGPNPFGDPIKPAELVLGDFNGDGKIDLAVSYDDVYSVPSVVKIYAGDGTGHFAAPQSVSVGANPFTLVSVPRAPFLDAGTFAVTDHGPVANNDSATVAPGSSVSVPVLANDTDADLAPLTITQIVAPLHGTAHFNPADNTIIYAAGAGFTGTDTFTYTIADPAGVESTANVTVVVKTINSLDVDGNGKADALTDGILILRYLFGFTGTTLTSGALASGATRTDPHVIAADLNGETATVLDVDGSGHADALTDGILILRYLFGFTGTTLTSGALSASATQTNPAIIQAFLDGYNPNVGHLWADAVGPGAEPGTPFTPDELQAITAAAIARWEATDLSALARERLESAQVQVADLNGASLGETYGSAVLIDRDAAGYGWFVDPTPFNDTEFQTAVGQSELDADGGSPAAGRMDLLTVVMHELGLVMGLQDTDLAVMPHSLMTDILGVGIRRLPPSV